MALSMSGWFKIPGFSDAGENARLVANALNDSKNGGVTWSL